MTLFDIRTLNLLSLFSSLLPAVAMLLAERINRDTPAIRLWVSGAAQAAAGFLLIALRHLIPELFSIVVANTLIATGLAWLVCGLVFGVRAVMSMFVPPGGDFMAVTEPIHKLAFVAILLLNVALTFGLTFLVAARTQRALRERERKLEAIVGNSPSALSLKTPDGRYALANPNLQRIHHCSEADIVGKTDFDLYPEPVARSFRANDEQVLATRARRAIEETIPVDGVERTYMSHMFPVLDAQGDVEYICRIALDITEKKRAEAELAAANARQLAEQQQARIATLGMMEDALAARDVAEKYAAAMQEAEARLRVLIDHAPIALALFDREMRYLAVSQRWREDFEIGARDVIGHSHYEIFPNLREEWKEAHRRGLAGEVVRSDGESFRRSDGRTIWTRWEVQPWHGADGSIGGIVIFAENITDRRAAELALRASEDRFHGIVNASADWIWEVDAAGRYTYVSESVESLLGYIPAEVIGKTPFDFMPPDEAERVRAEFIAIVARKAPFRDLDNINVRKDGSLCHVWTNGMPILAADGTLLGYRGLDRDITERKRAEQHLRESEARFRTLFDNASVGIFVHDSATGRIVDANRHGLEMFGYATFDQWSDKQFCDPPYSRADAVLMIHKAVSAGPQRFEWLSRRADGSVFWQEIQLEKIVIGGVERVLAVTVDIQARKAAEAELQARNAELLRFNQAMIGRELDMIEMKKTINALHAELDRAPPYPLDFLKDRDEQGAP